MASLYEACDFYRSAVQVTAFPSTLVSSNAQGDSFYSSLINQVDSTGTPIFTIFHSSIPAVYRTIREWYKNNDSYQLGPAHLSKALNCISNLGLDFGINLSGNLLTTFSLQDVLSTLDSNLVSTIFCESISGLLHAMPVTGKRIYSKTSGWWIFQHKDYLNFIGVNDNYSDQQHFLDYTAGLTGSLLRITLSL